jgi:phosphoribosylanthranilate isomerase
MPATDAPSTPVPGDARALVAPKVKICGLTTLDDAELVVTLGAWAIGMIFYPGSPRRCSREEAVRICSALRRRVELCGVYVNPSLEEVERDHIIRVLTDAVTLEEAADTLGISVATLWRKRKRYGIE